MTAHQSVCDGKSARTTLCSALHARLLAVALLVLVTGVASETRAEDYLRKLGGLGGGQFNDPCPAGQNLTGFELRAGDDVDAIRPVCAFSYSPSEISTPLLTTDSGLIETRLAFKNAVVLAPGWHGGPGGKLERLLCPASTPIVLGIDVGVEGVDTIIVNSIHLFCGRATINTQALSVNPSAVFELPRYVESPGWLGIGVGGDAARSSHDMQRCPDGQVAVGVHGRSGIWLDAIGLICDAPRLTARPPDGRRPVISAVGRVGVAAPSGTQLSICERARSARKRNSAAAPGLEAQCRALQPPIAAVGRASSAVPAGPPVSICDAARSARKRNSAAAPGLEARCLALGGNVDITAGGPSADELARIGEIIALANPLSAALRDQQPEGAIRRGFDIGMAAAEGHTVWSPDQQKTLDSLRADEQEGFKVAVSFSLDRTRNVELAMTGAAIAETDPLVARARTDEPDARYWLGFDIATGFFGDPTLGGQGNTATGPASVGIRDALSAPAQRGFDASMNLHLGPQ
jgi:hypothetical protein